MSINVTKRDAERKTCAISPNWLNKDEREQVSSCSCPPPSVADHSSSHLTALHLTPPLHQKAALHVWGARSDERGWNMWQRDSSLEHTYSSSGINPVTQTPPSLAAPPLPCEPCAVKLRLMHSEWTERLYFMLCFQLVAVMKNAINILLTRVSVAVFAALFHSPLWPAAHTQHASCCSNNRWKNIC